jgi:biotin transport system substrate-specific component
MAVGILLCYAFGTAWFVTVYNRGSGEIGVLSALSLCVFPYLIPDGVKIAMAALLTKRLDPLVNREGVQ